jgi:glycosyltransferase involved in cell wall biosynthesis
MRVLVLHNLYRSENASGENLSVHDEIDGLRGLGWDVEVLSADSDAITQERSNLVKVGLRPVYGGRSVRHTREAIGRFRPHVALVENLFPLHSPWVIRTLTGAGVPVAAGVRSFRMWCAASTMFRDGAFCDDCVGSRINAPAVRHGCFQGSRLRTAPLAASLALHRSTWDRIDAFLPVSEYVCDALIAVGMPSSRIVVRPNFVDDPGESAPWPDRNTFLFAGRVSPDKGIELMVEAWKRSEVWRHAELFVAGSGPMDGLVAGQEPEYRISPLGLLDHDELLTVVSDATVMVVPSVWPEPFGRGVIEAASRGRPSLVTRSGGLPSLVDDGVTGWVAEPDVDDLAAGFRRAADTGNQRRAGRAARARFTDRYTRYVSMAILDGTLTRLAEVGAYRTSIFRS